MSSALDPGRKIMTPDVAADWRRQAGRVVFTNGVFDLLHPGHVDLLVSARSLADALVVGLNTDASVKRLKGPSRPVRNERERAHVLAALESVDAVVLFGEDTPLELIRHIMPDILVKGGDYTVETVVGATDVLAHGGDVVIVPLTPGQSTTGILSKLQSGSVQ